MRDFPKNPNKAQNIAAKKAAEEDIQNDEFGYTNSSVRPYGFYSSGKKAPTPNLSQYDQQTTSPGFRTSKRQ